MDATATPQHSNIITRWKLVSHLKQEFWRRWSSEYLNQLQQRYKWKQRCHNVQPNTMVIIKEDNLPPLKWPLGRIVKTYIGPDNLVRVADVRTENGTLRRAIHKRAPLPMNEDQEEDEIEPPSSNTIDDIEAQGTARPASDQSNPHRRLISINSTSSQTRETSLTDTAPRKRQRRSIGSAFVSLFLVCLTFSTTRSAPVETTPFKLQPGIYFEGLGSTNIISSEWNLVAYYDMQPFWKEFDALVNSSRILKTVCDQIIERNACEQIREHLQFLTKELSANNELLLPTENKGRAKRGAINFIGNIANTLFGVLDSEYAEDMSKTINEIKQNENHLVALIKNQTSIIDATINIMRKNQETIDKQFRNWEIHINKISAEINGIHQDIYQEKLSNVFITLAMQAMLTASNFQRIQGVILDILVDTHNGEISPQLITPDQMRQELTTIKGHLPSSLKLSLTIDDVLQFYNLMTIEGRPTAEHIIFKLRLPLCTLEDFELFSIIPVPTLINNTFLAIQPSFPYLVVNLHRDQYYPLTEHSLQACRTITRGRHLCKQHHPIYHKGSALGACEIDFINRLPQSPTCKIVQTGDGPHWTQLHNPNEWLFALKEKTTINVVCEDTVNQMAIERSGILRLQKECIIKQPLITIRGHNAFPTSSRMSYIPTTNQTHQVKLEGPRPNISDGPDLKPQGTELESIQKQIQQLHIDLPTIHPHDVHQFAIGYTGLALVFAIIIFIIWTYKSRICSRIPTKPTPQPRRYISQADCTSYQDEEKQVPDVNIDFNS